MKITPLNSPKILRKQFSSFGGYDKRNISNGIVFTDTENMSSDLYPLAVPRKKRKTISFGNTEVYDIMSLDFRHSRDIIKGALFADCENKIKAIFDDGTTRDAHNIANTTSFATGRGKMAVPADSHLYFFPDNMAIDLLDYATLDCLDAFATFHLGLYEGYFYELSFNPCDINGNPVSGSSSFMRVVRKCYNVSNGQKSTYNTYMPLNASFNKGDTVRIKGLSNNDLNGYYNIKHIDINREGFVIACPTPHTQSSGTVYITRQVPQMDYVVAAKNRLWGCRYGIDEEGNTLNEIYASALGDATNWQVFEGVSTDSWTANVGEPGAFTGAVSYNGYPIFFKENCVIKVFGDYPSQYTVSETKVRGVENGSSKSVAVVNDILYYKSSSGIVKFDGGIPINIDEKLGNTVYKNAVASALGSKYYISMEDENGRYHLFIYDTDRDIWYRSGEEKIVSFCTSGNTLYMLTDQGEIIAENSSDGTEEDDFKWYCITNSLGYEYPEQKYISSLQLRLDPEIGAVADIEIEYDDDGIWHHAASVFGGESKKKTVSLSPKRCDSFKLKISGSGKCVIRSITFSIEKAGDFVI